jgi:hypothetical protein
LVCLAARAAPGSPPKREGAPEPAAAELSDCERLGEGGVERLSVFPERLDLRGADSAARLVVTGVDAAGGARDLTREAGYAASQPSLAAVDAAGVVRALADGDLEIVVSAGGREARVAVAVREAAVDRPINFPNEIVPVFSKHGCNAGGCHGKSGGQNGFRLSLFGYQPEVDYRSLALEARGRRVFPAAPEHSLLLLKASGAVPHGGGERFAAGSPDYRLLERWMRAGLPYGKPEDAAVTGISVYPRSRVLGMGAAQQLAVIAQFSNGEDVDVTPWAQFSSDAPDYLDVDARGLARASDLAGQGTVLARFRGHVALFRATVPSKADLAGFPWPEEKNFIDRHVFARLKRLGIPPAPLADDATFLRRASLLICGTLPAASEAGSFLADTSPEKRERLIDRLLERPEHARYFALLWADLLRNRRGGDNQMAPLTLRFHAWIRESLLAKKPFDQFVRELICAEGSAADNPAVVWYQFLENPKLVVDDLAQVFLGTRMQCARCHHHPFEKWGQEDYWHFANFFSRLQRRDERSSREGFVLTVRSGRSQLGDDEPTSASYKKSYAALQPPGGEKVEETTYEDPRRRLADWMLAGESPLFAKALVNRYWKHFFGRGLVEPEDDLRETNPPTHPELLDALARDFVAQGYDLRRLTAVICKSAAFQLSAEPRDENRRDRQNFSRFQPRRLPAEVLLDALDIAAGTRSSFNGAPRDARAIDLPDESSRNYFLEVFGKPERATACACERSGEVTLSQALHLLNSRDLLDKLGGSGARPALLAAGQEPEPERIRQIFLGALTRFPSEKEQADAAAYLDGQTDPNRRDETRRLAWRDLLWALVNTKEFLFVR